jgi:hypothetical protein
MNAANWKFQEMNLIASDYWQESSQQNVHWAAGTRRVFWAFSELWQFSVSKLFSPQPPVTLTVGHPLLRQRL